MFNTAEEEIQYINGQVEGALTANQPWLDARRAVDLSRLDLEIFRATGQSLGGAVPEDFLPAIEDFGGQAAVEPPSVLSTRGIGQQQPSAELFRTGSLTPEEEQLFQAIQFLQGGKRRQEPSFGFGATGR